MGSVFVVTGATGGIGEAVALELLRRGRTVIAGCREPERGLALAEAARAGGLPAPILARGDLSELDGMHAAADAVLATGAEVAALVHNAGLWPTRFARTSLGIERSFAVHVLAPYVLTARLWPRLASGRIVFVGAGLYVLGRPSLDDAVTGARFSAWRTYCDTKLCAARLALWLARRAGAAPAVQTVHPGVVRTRLGEGDWRGTLLRPFKRLWSTPEQGARPVVRLADEPLEGATGRYWDVDRELPWRNGADDEAAAEALAARCAELASLRFP